MLAPGESQTLTFTLDARNLASFDSTQSAWVAEAGQYRVRVGASVADIRLEASFSLGGDLVAKKATKALAPSQRIEELTAPPRE